VLIIEREEHQAMGSTGKSAGGVRAQFATAINIRMSLHSIAFFARFEDETGHTAGYKPHGYLFLATSQNQLDYLRANRERQVALGLKDVEIISTADVASMIPQLRLDDVVGASFCPTDGFVDPYSVMRGFTIRAKERGARLWMSTDVTGILMDGGRVAGVSTTRGDVSTRTVVNAAGPWAAQVAQYAGFELPVTPLRRQIVNTEPFDGLPSPLPMVIDMSNGFHFRREGSGIMMAWPDKAETFGFKLDFDQEFIEKILTCAVDRVPIFADVPVNPRRCWAGLYEVTPDHHAVIGAAPGIEGFYLANGFSGHGVMHSPATGKTLAELILSGTTSIEDVDLLGPGRFAAGKLLKETAVI
jgi:sarcosine oxidase subunit beta